MLLLHTPTRILLFYPIKKVEIHLILVLETNQLAIPKIIEYQAVLAVIRKLMT
jgi:hypothetical protein